MEGLSHAIFIVLHVTQSQIELPDENRLDLPAAWTKGVLASVHREPDPSAPALWREQIEQQREAIDLALGFPENAPFVGAIRAHLDGEPDAVGAAAVLFLAQTGNSFDPVRNIALDAWRLEHGLPFAASAIAEEGGLYLEPRSIQNPDRSGPRVRTGVLAASNHVAVADWDRNVTAGLRGDIERCGENEYRAVRDTVAEHRSGPGQRSRAALLLPGEHDWVAETCSEAPYSNEATDGEMWALIKTAEQLNALPALALWPNRVSPATLGSLIAGLGADSLPALVATLDLDWEPNAEQRRTLLAGIAMLPGDDAMRWLIEHLTEPHVAAAAVEAARRFPVRALHTVASRAAPENERDRRSRAATLAEIDPAVFEAAMKQLTEAERADIRALMSRPDPMPEADPGTLPRLLVDPPWAKPRPKTKPKTIKGLKAPESTTLEWLPGEQDRYLTAGDRHYEQETDWAAWADGAHYKPGSASVLLAYGPLDSGRELIANRKWKHRFDCRIDAIPRILGRFEAAAVPAFVKQANRNTHVRKLLLPVVDLEVARLMAEWYSRFASERALAVGWLDRHATSAARLLLPDALGEKGKARDHAAAALRCLAVRHDGAVVLDAAAEYGPAAVEASRPILEADPLEPIVEVPKLNTWAGPVLLPQVRVAGGDAALPEAAVRHLMQILAIASPTYDYEGIDIVAQTCDRASLRAFSHALFESWLAVGAPSKDGWALTQLSHFGDDETVRLLAPLIREWPGQNQHKRAVSGLGVLGRIGTEEALRAMQSISQRVKFKALKVEAGRQIEVTAAGLGLTREQLADRLVPDLGLGRAGSLVLDFGPRKFTVVFDEHLKPSVTDEEGKPRKSLPKPGAKDDGELANAAYKRFTKLKKELRTVATDQVRRLEAAMVNARTWNRDEFERLFFGHELMRHLADRMIWLAESGGERFGFRIAEDGTLSDIEEATVELPEDAVIRLAHPVHMEPDQLAAWSQILADYEVLQPFEQLTRTAMVFTDEELKTGDLLRFQGFEVDSGKILGMTKYGWVRCSPQDNGTEWGIHYPLPRGGYVIVALHPGISIGMGADNEAQQLERVFLSNSEIYWRRQSKSHPTDIDPVTASEVLASLDRLTGRS